MVRGVPRRIHESVAVVRTQSSVVADESNQSTLDLCAPRDWVGVPGGSGARRSLSRARHCTARLALARAVVRRRRPPFLTCSGLADSTRSGRHAADRAGRILRSIILNLE